MSKLFWMITHVFCKKKARSSKNLILGSPFFFFLQKDRQFKNVSLNSCRFKKKLVYYLNEFFVRFTRWKRSDSNRWLYACKAYVLPTELHPRTGDRTWTCMTTKPQGLNLVCLPISPHPHESWDWLVVHFISLSWMEHWGSHFPFCLQKKQNWF